MTYLALVQEDDWSLNREDLVRALRADWPSIAVEATSSQGDPARDVTWSYGVGEARVEGAAHESGQCVYLEGQKRAVARFVLWFRQTIPTDRTVVLCDDTYSFDAAVESGSTLDDVLSLFP